jgi:hypothetical protein
VIHPDMLRKTFSLLDYDGFLFSEVSGYAGGIVVAWKTKSFVVHLLQKKFQFLHIKMSYPRGRTWLFTAVYASPNEDNRRILWNDLKDIATSNRDPWLLAGDFNDILGANEKIKEELQYV